MDHLSLLLKPSVCHVALGIFVVTVPSWLFNGTEVRDVISWIRNALTLYAVVEFHSKMSKPPFEKCETRSEINTQILLFNYF